MKISEVEYSEDLRTKAVHLASSEVIITDAPTDNQGRGEAFSPTDLLSTSLASCMFTLMGIAAGKHGFQFEGGKAEVHKVMLSNPRRVGTIKVQCKLRGSYSEKERQILENTAINCPVAKSLSEEITQDITFHYEVNL